MKRRNFLKGLLTLPAGFIVSEKIVNNLPISEESKEINITNTFRGDDYLVSKKGRDMIVKTISEHRQSIKRILA